MSRTVSAAVASVAAQQRLSTLTALKQINERAVFDSIVATTADERVVSRVNGVVMAGLSFAKV